MLPESTLEGLKVFTKVRVYLAATTLVVAMAVPTLLSADAPAGASTTACESACTSPSVLSLGTGQVLTVSGTSVVMSAASTTNSGEDWTPLFEGPVSGAVTAGVVSSKLLMSYSSGTLFELEYAPNGVPSDQCLADSYTGPSIINTNPAFNVPNLSVGLAQCGITAASLWIVDPNNESNGYTDLVNAGYEAVASYLAENNNADVSNLTTPFAESAVLAVNSSNKVVLAPLSEIGGVVSPTQMWISWTTSAQAAVRRAVQAEHRKSLARIGG